MSQTLRKPTKRKRTRHVPSVNGSKQADLLERLQQNVFGQDEALQEIVQYIWLAEAGIAQDNRPLGTLLLLGPTGSGKTYTVEALARQLHGSPMSYLRIDCGEYQMDHEVAKLIGAPPGYLGHRETHPALSAQRLVSVASEACSISLVLFDEIEKAAPSLTRILLGILDRGTLQLGDNTRVNFCRSLIFLTSNLGARDMEKGEFPFGYANGALQHPNFQAVGTRAAKKFFAPEFMNRIDRVLVYKTLDKKTVQLIIEHELADLTALLKIRVPGLDSIRVSGRLKKMLLDCGYSATYGARQLKRVINSRITRELARRMVHGELPIKMGEHRVLMLDARGGDVTFELAFAVGE